MKLHTVIKQQESIRTITVVCTVLELSPFELLMEETGFSERNCYLKCLNRERDQFSFRKQIQDLIPFN